jgi:hypothetical protein
MIPILSDLQGSMEQRQDQDRVSKNAYRKHRRHGKTDSDSAEKNTTATTSSSYRFDVFRDETSEVRMGNIHGGEPALYRAGVESARCAMKA